MIGQEYLTTRKKSDAAYLETFVCDNVDKKGGGY